MKFLPVVIPLSMNIPIIRFSMEVLFDEIRDVFRKSLEEISSAPPEGSENDRDVRGRHYSGAYSLGTIIFGILVLFRYIKIGIGLSVKEMAEALILSSWSSITGLYLSTTMQDESNVRVYKVLNYSGSHAIEFQADHKLRHLSN